MALNLPETGQKRVAIVGSGFGGLELAKALRRDKEIQIVLIDKNNYHTFQPFLYQVAIAGLEADAIAFPLRKLFRRQSNCHVRRAVVEKIIPEKQTLLTSAGKLHYDELVLAHGSQSNFFGMEGFRKNALDMKTIPQALELRNAILESFENALHAETREEREAYLHFVIIGGGPTGIEMAGGLDAFRRHIMPQDYPELPQNEMKISILEMKDRLLPLMSDLSSRHVGDYCKKRDIRLYLGKAVSDYDGSVITFKNGDALKSRTVIWAAGVQGSVIEGISQESVSKTKQYLVNPYNQVHGYENIYAIGDNALMETVPHPKGYPMMAPIAIQQADQLAENLRRKWASKPAEPFLYRNRGTMATVGRTFAVADLPFGHFYGLAGWVLWLFIHVFALLVHKNKIRSLFNWIWSYYNYQRGWRIILKPIVK